MRPASMLAGFFCGELRPAVVLGKRPGCVTSAQRSMKYPAVPLSKCCIRICALI